MGFNFETSLGQYINTADKIFHEMIKREIKAKLMQHAHAVVNEAAEEMTKDLLIKMQSAVSPTDQVLDIRLTLNIGGEDKKFVVKKSVEQV